MATRREGAQTVGWSNDVSVTVAASGSRQPICLAMQGRQRGSNILLAVNPLNELVSIDALTTRPQGYGKPFAPAECSPGDDTVTTLSPSASPSSVCPCASLATSPSLAALSVKRVSFDPQMAIFNYDDETDTSLLHYTPAERYAMNVQSKQLVKQFTRLNPRWCEQLDQLFESSSTTGTRGTLTLSPMDIFHQVEEVRGLESTFSKVMRPHRQRAIQRILELQANMTRYQSSDTTPVANNQRHTLLALGLRACSVHASQKSRHFAWLVATSDAAMVHEHDDANGENEP